MTYQPTAIPNDLGNLPHLPGWVTSGRTETLETVAFRSGAALNHLHLALGREEVPKALLRARLALRAAEACVAFSGRPERAGELNNVTMTAVSYRHARDDAFDLSNDYAFETV